MVQLLSLLSAISGFVTLATAQSASPCHVASTRLYIDAIYAKTRTAANRIPLTLDVIRREGTGQGEFVTARSAPELRRSIYLGLSPFYFQGNGPDGLDIGDIVPTVTVAAWNATIRGLPGGENGTRAIQYTTFKTPQSCEISQIDAVYVPIDE